MLESSQIKLSNLQYELQKLQNDLSIARQHDILHNEEYIENETQWMISKKLSYKRIKKIIKNITQVKRKIDDITMEINHLVAKHELLLTKKNQLFKSYENQRKVQSIFKKVIMRNFANLKNNTIFNSRKAQNKLHMVKILFIYIDPISQDKLLNIEFLLNEVNNLHSNLFIMLKK